MGKKKFFIAEEGWRRKGLPQYLVLTTFPICQESQDLEVFCFPSMVFMLRDNGQPVSFSLATSSLLRDGLVEMALHSSCYYNDQHECI